MSSLIIESSDDGNSDIGNDNNGSDDNKDSGNDRGISMTIEEYVVMICGMKIII